MSDWLSYRPADFLLFGPETYFRLFQRWNHDGWFVHGIVTVCLILGLTLLLRRQSLAMRWLPGSLAMAWGWATVFLWVYYRPINFAVPALLVVPALCALTLLVFAARERPKISDRMPVRILASMTVLSVLGDAVHVLASERNLASMQWLGNTPDTVAMFTLAWAAVLVGRARWLLAIPAAIWLLIAWVTVATLGSAAAWWIGCGLTAGLVATAWPRRSDSECLAPGSIRV